VGTFGLAKVTGVIWRRSESASGVLLNQLWTNPHHEGARFCLIDLVVRKEEMRLLRSELGIVCVENDEKPNVNLKAMLDYAAGSNSSKVM
jgi:hypothetical protein